MKSFDKILEKHGRSVCLHDGEWNSPQFKAFVSPIRYKNKMYMNGYFTEIGHYNEGYYLYIGPASHNLRQLSNQAFIHTADGVDYKIHRAEIVYQGDKPFYIWAIIKEKVQVVY